MKKILVLAIVLLAGCSAEVQYDSNTRQPELKPTMPSVIKTLEQKEMPNPWTAVTVSLVEIDGHKYIIANRSAAISLIHAESCIHVSGE